MMLKLYKPIGDLQASDACPSAKEDLNLYLNKGAYLKPNKQVSMSHCTPAVIQCDSYENIWLQSNALDPTSCFWPNDVLHSNGMNQPLDVTTIRRPLTRQSSLEVCSQSNCRQDSNSFSVDVNNNLNGSLYHQFVPRAHQGLSRSTDSGLYSDPECHRPLSSDSSTSACSSFSHSNWEGSTTSSSSWDRSPPNGTLNSSHVDLRNRQLLKRSVVDCQSLPPKWHVEDQPVSFFSTDLKCNRSGIWSSRFQSQEDHELIDNLFTKEDRAMNPPNTEYQEINLSLRALSLSTSNGPSNDYGFCRAVQPPQSCIGSGRGHLNSSSRRVF